VIERRHPGEALLLRQIDGFGFRFVKIGTVEQHFAAKSAHRIDFNICRCYWHDDQGFQPQSRSRERHALGMVACGRRDHTTRFLLVGQPGHHRVGTAQFEAVYRLTVFTLHQNDVIQPRRELVHFLQRGNLHRFIDRRTQHRPEIFCPLRGRR